MPQLILEYSENITEKNDLDILLNNLNHYLSNTLPADLTACKSRAIRQGLYSIGDGNSNNAFVHVQLKVMSGRTEEKLREVGLGIKAMVADYFQQPSKQLNLQVTVEVSELSKHYFKEK